jgi:hypothetical protein
MLVDLMAFVAAGAWLAAAALVGLPCLTPPDRRPTLAECSVAATLGLCSAGLAWIFAAAAGVGAFAPHLSAAVLAVPAAAVLYTRRWMSIPTGLRGGAQTIATALVFLIWFAPVIAGAWRMGVGRYPSMFFNVDTPFRLLHVRELARSASFPPASLANVGMTGANHYGGPAAATVIASLTGLPEHTALFVVVLPVAALGAFAAALLVSRHLARDAGGMLPIAVLLLLLTSWLWPVRELIAAARRSVAERGLAPLQGFATDRWLDPQSFGNSFEDITHLFGRTLFLLACLPLITSERRTRWAAAFGVVILGQVKTGHALIAGVALSVASVVEAVRRGRVSVLIPAGIAAGLSAALIKLGSVGGLFAFHVEPFWMLRHFPRMVELHLLAFAVIALAPVAAAAAFGRSNGTWRRPHRPVLPLLLATVASYGVFQVIGASWSGRTWVVGEPPVPGPFAAALESLLQMPMLFAMIGGAGVATVWESIRPAGRRAALFVIVVLTVPALAHRTRGAIAMVVSPETAHEQADNRAIAAALESIPLHGSVIATNDLLYPANNYGRDLMQYQIPAVMGHQAFGLPGYDRYQGWEARVLLQRALRQSTSSCADLRALAEAGVTHVLLHKRARHPESLPLRRIFDSDRYAVYELGRVGACEAPAPTAAPPPASR